MTFPVLPSLSRRERLLAGFLLLLWVLAAAAPALPMPAALAVGFADGRGWHGLPNALDVLSNLPFALLGLAGLWRLHRADRCAHPEHGADEHAGNALDCAWLFFAGLLVTAAGSAFFHLQPDVHRLAADRAGMAVAFAGLVGLAVCERVSPRAGWATAWCTLAGGLLAAAVAAETGNVLPWALVQFGGMALVLAMALAPRVRGALGLNLGTVIACYAVAKLLEVGDHAIYEATAHLVSGHTLKHLVAALAALPVLAMVRAAGRGGLRHNPAPAAATA
ncbi:hypothetical protein [Xenophilus sp.]|uniref:hypothetical protein n=1 Tax=Xenophilus sp. TaxID=1873499 RepID=UPI0037DCFBAA